MLIFNAIMFALNGTCVIYDILKEDIDKSTLFCAFVSGMLLMELF